MTQPILFRLNAPQLNLGSGMRKGVPPSLHGFEPLPAPYLRIFGVTRDSAGAALPACDVHLFRTADDVEVDQLISDGSGNYEFRSASLSTLYYVVAYKVGVPDVAGTTVNFLIGA